MKLDITSIHQISKCFKFNLKKITNKIIVLINVEQDWYDLFCLFLVSVLCYWNFQKYTCFYFITSKIKLFSRTKVAYLYLNSCKFGLVFILPKSFELYSLDQIFHLVHNISNCTIIQRGNRSNLLENLIFLWSKSNWKDIFVCFHMDMYYQKIIPCTNFCRGWVGLI